jgi:hypothetical protein
MVIVHYIQGLFFAGAGLAVESVDKFKKIRIATPRLTKATPRLGESGSHRLSDSPSFILKLTLRLAQSGSRLLPVSPSLGVVYSLTRRV